MSKQAISHEAVLLEIGKRLRVLRKEKLKMSLVELEKVYGVNWRMLQQIESGKRNVTVRTLLRLAEIYKTDLYKLFK